jgi:type II secretory pathway pseudopilin PulG
MRERTRQATLAFTLAELLIALSITALIVVMLGRVFTATATQWQAADQRIDSFRDARAALQIMAHDLSRAHLDGDPQMLTLSDYASDSNGNQYAKEAFVIGPTANSGKSDLCAVGYYLSWDATVKAYRLKRLLKNSDQTVTILANTAPNFTSLYSKDPVNDEDVATYAWDLRFRPGTLNNPEAPNANLSTKWQWIEVRFKAMSAAAAKKLTGLNVSQSTWDNPTDTTYRRLILPNEQQFVTRIKVHQAP